ncbi:MAG: zinc-dependent metalloprotease [Woeseia sp.]|nr:zinc-dependent metalloprotease [Woeseia sp.]
MRRILLLAAVLLASCGESLETESFSDTLAGFERLAGFVDLYRDDAGGRLYLRVTELNEPLLYQASMARGVGSNDLGLDRGQLGPAHIVSFQRHGNRILLVADNIDYRADSNNVDEQRAVDASFAESVLWGFEIAGEHDGDIVIDATDFFLRDSHGLSRRLSDAGEGSYSVDSSRSAIFAPRTKAFPDNSEIEAVITYVGTPTGEILYSVVPDATSITVHLHHSFVRLPDEGYEPLPYDPRAGLIGLSYEASGFYDYATPIGDDITVRYARRHRLQKADPSASVSDAVEPIVYYVDRGAPEPVRTALLDGASWWNEAYAAAGYRDAFRVELLPEDADPMDVRYNVIQWVHRSTRGWSYGSSVLDPRTGEIIKGHVTLGSLRVRQDYLIAEGLLAPYDNEEQSDAMLAMALARIRQLSAHEVGHTIGIEHNFAASTQGRSSVMDYPFPLIRIDANGDIDLSDAYGVGIGAWDKRVILYGYQDFPENVDADAARAAILDETLATLKYVADQDSRAVGSAQPDGNLWDNGADAIEELQHLLRVRDIALARFGAVNIRAGRPLATIEEALVPIYLLHRFQLHAVAKLIGGNHYSYALRGDGQSSSQPVSPERQRAGISALLETLSPTRLALPTDLLDELPPRPPGYPKSRETFPSYTGAAFDPLGPASSAAALTLEALLDPSRAARLISGHSLNPRNPGFDELLSSLLSASWLAPRQQGLRAEIRRTVNMQVLTGLLRLATNNNAAPQVRALAIDSIAALNDWLEPRTASEIDAAWRAHYRFARQRIAQFERDQTSIGSLPEVTVPPGSPIGAY